MTVRAVVTPHAMYAVTGTGYKPAGSILLNGQKVNPLTQSDLVAALNASVLCNGAELSQDEHDTWSIVGDPTEGALLVAAQKAGVNLSAVRDDHPLVAELPFDARRKCMSMVRRLTSEHLVVYTKGAPDVVLQFCSTGLVNGAVVPMDTSLMDAMLQANERLAGEALRVLAVAMRELPDSETALTPEVVEHDMTFLGLIAMINVVISLYYYLLVIKAAYLTEPRDETGPLVVSPSIRILAAALASGMVVAGFFPTYLMEIADSAARVLLSGR